MSKVTKWDADSMVGNIYRVRHTRKGVFDMLVTAVDSDGTWAHGVIMDGTTRAMMPANVRTQGEQISVRASLCTLELVSSSDNSNSTTPENKEA